MHRVVRKFLFAFFVALFVVLAPLVILYTAGYRLNITSRRVLQTGVMAITTVPRGASISLDGNLLSGRSPFVAQRITPKTYDVRIERKDFHPWEQNIVVREGETSYVYARLFADHQPVPLADDASGKLLAEHNRNIEVTPSDIDLVNRDVHVEVWHKAFDGDALLGLLPANSYTILHDDGSYLLLEDASHHPFVVARQGNGVTELSPAITAFAWLDDAHELLWTDGTEVALYNAGSGERLTITRLGEPIINVAWHSSGDTMFYGTSQAVFAAAREQYDTRPTTTLAENLSITDFWVTENSKTLYLVDEGQGVASLSLTE